MLALYRSRPAGARRSPPSSGPGRSSPRSSGSIRRRSSGASTSGSFARTPTSTCKGEPLRGYRLLEQIGEGAFGVVYRAIQPQVAP